MRKSVVCALLVAALCCLPLAAQTSAPAPAAPAAEKAKPAKTAPAKRKAPSKININWSSVKRLATLPGIDAATAEKIHASRPYKTTDELVTKNIVTQEQYDKIKSKIYAKPHAAATKPKPKPKPAPATPAPATTEKPKQ